MDINKVIKSAQDKCKIEYGKESQVGYVYEHLTDQ